MSTRIALDRKARFVPVFHPAAQNAYLIESRLRKYSRGARRALFGSSNGY
jgi:hypothetical protein